MKKKLYERYFKRILDIAISSVALIFLSPVILFIAILVRIKLGTPIVFKQLRPGKNEKVFTIYKFRTMTSQKDGYGNLLPDEMRLTKFGRFLRSSSCDELLEIINIIKGDMSIVGPRPQLVKDMVFMTPEQRCRYCVRQGLTGLAQINGRNNISWEEKLEWDLKYVDNITFYGDLKIIFRTIKKVMECSDIVREGTSSDMDFGDYLLLKGKITKQIYRNKLIEAEQLLKNI